MPAASGIFKSDLAWPEKTAIYGGVVFPKGRLNQQLLLRLNSCTEFIKQVFRSPTITGKNSENLAIG